MSKAADSDATRTEQEDQLQPEDVSFVFRGRGRIHRKTGLITQVAPFMLPESEVSG